jgi:two-component system, sensor histidine kinase and response regulator
VIGLTDLALSTDLSSEQRDYLEVAKISADSLLTVISDILDFSKIESGKVDIEAIAFNLRDWLDTTLKTLSPRANAKGLEMVCDVSPEVPLFLKGDSTRLRQVLVNLVGNAIKFTQAGEIEVKVSVDSSSRSSCVLRFLVSDTGVGIAKEKLKMIFDPFSQADTSTTREFGGTGLGLSISTRLIELMGGRIWVESEPGQGSDFCFIVSFALADEGDMEARIAASTEALHGVRVLVVDDNRTNLRILDGMLSRWEMSPHCVDGGEAALKELSNAISIRRPYHLILTDMHMPNMDGFALVEHVRQRVELTAITIMMLTSGGQKGDQARCRALGLAAYLWKPIAESQLRDTLVRVLTKSDHASQTAAVSSMGLEDVLAPRPSLRVLVAEDNQVNQFLIARLLQKQGHVVVMASNGIETLKALGKGAFDLILMDVQMPEMGGVETTAAIRKNERLTGRHLPIVALTANAMKGDREKYLACGMDEYLTKPIDQIELFELLAKYVTLGGAGSSVSGGFAR